MMLRPFLGSHGISFLTALSLIACGGRVVVDRTGSGGGTTTSGEGGFGTCSAPGLVGDVSSCAVSPPIDPAFCNDWTLCDSGGHQWRAQCDESGCHCLVDDHELCACTFEAPPCGGAGCCDAFLGVGGSCCPYPWLRHDGCTPVGADCTTNGECCNYLCTDGLCQP